MKPGESGPFAGQKIEKELPSPRRRWGHKEGKREFYHALDMEEPGSQLSFQEEWCAVATRIGRWSEMFSRDQIQVTN